MIKRCLAEALGTFAIVYFGCGSGISLASQGSVAHLAVSSAFGLVVAAMVYALGPISGAHLNPAVTIGLASGGHSKWSEAVPYIAAQCGGALAASGVHSATIQNLAVKSNYGATLPNAGMVPALIIEVVSTFLFMLVIVSVATDERVHRAAPALAIGMMVAVGGIFAGPLTGNSLNPARSLGPAVFAGGEALSSIWIYWVAPITGAVLAVQVYRYLKETATVS